MTSTKSGSEKMREMAESKRAMAEKFLLQMSRPHTAADFVNKLEKLLASVASDARREIDEAAEFMWVVLANVSEGDWTKQRNDWQEAAARARGGYLKAIGPRLTTGDDNEGKKL
jgi:hypothetical protein